MLKATIIIVILLISLFSWSHWTRVRQRAPGTCWAAGAAQGYIGDGNRADYEPADVMMFAGFGVVAYQPSSWKNNPPPQDRSLKVFYCSMKFGSIEEVDAVDWEQAQQAPANKN